MKNYIRKCIIRYLKDAIVKLESDNCELSDDEQNQILSTIAHRAVSKDEACKIVDKSRSRFDDLIRAKVLPKGRKRRGFKELVWYEDELITANINK